MERRSYRASSFLLCRSHPRLGLLIAAHPEPAVASTGLVSAAVVLLLIAVLDAHAVAYACLGAPTGKTVQWPCYSAPRSLRRDGQLVVLSRAHGLRGSCCCRRPPAINQRPTRCRGQRRA
jgi:hypothetical protein